VRKRILPDTVHTQSEGLMPRSSRRVVRTFKRAHTAEIKFRAVLDVIRGDLSLAEVAQVYEASPSTLKQWKARFLERGAQVFKLEPTDQVADQADGRAIRAYKLGAEAHAASAQRGATGGMHDPEPPTP
jgi:transposase-like protein